MVLLYRSVSAAQEQKRLPDVDDVVVFLGRASVTTQYEGSSKGSGTFLYFGVNL